MARALTVSLALVAMGLAACSDGPPRVERMSPAAGDYGSLVTIEGQDLRGSDSARSEDLAVLLAEDGNPGREIAFRAVNVDRKQGPVVSTSDTEIELRFPFPHGGKVRVQTDLGEAEAGSFTPSWRPGPGFELPAMMDAMVLPGGAIAVVADDDADAPARLAVFDGDRSAAFDLPRGRHKLRAARFFRRSDDVIEGVALSGDEPPELLYLAEKSGAFTLEPTGVRSTQAFLAAGVDAAGSYAWVHPPSGGTVRVRPSSSWAVDRGPIADPPDLDDALAAAVMPDGTLLFAADEIDNDFLDTTSNAVLCMLPPDASAFAACEQAAGPVDDYVTAITLTVAPSGDRIKLDYCSKNEDLLTGTTVRCDNTRVRAADGTWSVPRLAVDDVVTPQDLYVMTAGGFAALAARGFELDLYADTDGPKAALPLYPASPYALVPAPDGALRTLVYAPSTGAVYAPEPR